MAGKFTNIAEMLHASIPSTAKAMKELHELGDNAFEVDSPQLQAIKKIIESQADNNAHYIEINVDEFITADNSLAISLMKKYVELVRQFAKGIAPCIDSSDDALLIAGLEQWYSNADGNTAPPMLNSVKISNKDLILPLKEKYDFCFIALLLSDEQIGGTEDVDKFVSQASEIYDAAVKAGFDGGDIFYDTGVFPLAIDLPMNPGQISYAYRTFETVKAIKADSRFENVHFSLGFSNCCRDLPARRLGIIRAYVQKAISVGVDAGIVNVKHDFASGNADETLLALVEAFAQIDGDMNKLMTAMQLMTEFCQSCKQN